MQTLLTYTTSPVTTTTTSMLPETATNLIAARNSHQTTVTRNVLIGIGVTLISIVFFATLFIYVVRPRYHRHQPQGASRGKLQGVASPATPLQVAQTAAPARVLVSDHAWGVVTDGQPVGWETAFDPAPRGEPPHSHVRTPTPSSRGDASSVWPPPPAPPSSGLSEGVSMTIVAVGTAGAQDDAGSAGAVPVTCAADVCEVASGRPLRSPATSLSRRTLLHPAPSTTSDDGSEDHTAVPARPVSDAPSPCEEAILPSAAGATSGAAAPSTPVSAYGQPRILYTYETTSTNTETDATAAPTVQSTRSPHRQRQPVLGRVVCQPRPTPAATSSPPKKREGSPRRTHERHPIRESPATSLASSGSMPDHTEAQVSAVSGAAASATTGDFISSPGAPRSPACQTPPAKEVVGDPASALSAHVPSAWPTALPTPFLAAAGPSAHPRHGVHGDEFAETSASLVTSTVTSASLWVVGKLASSADGTFSTLPSTATSTRTGANTRRAPESLSAPSVCAPMTHATGNAALAAALEAVMGLDSQGSPPPPTTSAAATTEAAASARPGAVSGARPNNTHTAPRCDGFTRADGGHHVPHYVLDAHTSDAGRDVPDDDEDLSPDEREALAQQAARDQRYARVAGFMQMRYN